MTQQQRLLKYLQEGTVNSYTATFVYGIKQAPTRIKELREQGYNIESYKQPNRSVDWVLSTSPIVKNNLRPIEATKEWVFTTDGRAYLKQEPTYKQEVLL